MHFASRILLLVVLALPPAALAQQRIASLNLCLDQILLRWVDPQNIVSVTWLSGEDHYRRAPLPEHVYLNRAQAEELLPLQPDLILVGQFGAQRAAQRLRDLGLNVVAIPDAYSLEQLRDQLSALETTLGQLPPLQKQKRQLAKLLAAPLPPAQASALILSANNITYGDGMLEHQLLERAGFSNLAAQQGVKQLGRVSLEEVVAAQPDLLVFYGGEKDFAVAHLATRHPALKNYIDSGRIYTLPEELGFCPALVAAEVLEQLTDKRKSFVDAQ
ncbi:iron complex transport system substrate-binding protein [Microbulbifer donghaiensis]|uniref:Iron complex transport system substrate-binding protein n=1 Tax=Microbulbifer donghaiensis TaxID=494016 RepID=A0A1M4ZHT0_9GAMM|nr:ABC transporter substrate-binding protein [Microbulbifer donghaiensis]SHF17551.1 iron complex transport system substrate-binding protein [Microbulbifer donghaiensis]